MDFGNMKYQNPLPRYESMIVTHVPVPLGAKDQDIQWSLTCGICLIGTNDCLIFQKKISGFKMGTIFKQNESLAICVPSQYVSI